MARCIYCGAAARWQAGGESRCAGHKGFVPPAPLGTPHAPVAQSAPMAHELTAEQVAELRRLEAAATPGPWGAHQTPWVQSWAADARGGEVFFASYERSADVTLMVAMRNALPTLLAALDTTRAAEAVALACSRQHDAEAETERLRGELAASDTLRMTSLEALVEMATVYNRCRETLVSERDAARADLAAREADLARLVGAARAHLDLLRRRDDVGWPYEVEEALAALPASPPPAEPAAVEPTIRLTPEGMVAFQTMLDAPAAPTQALIDLMTPEHATTSPAPLHRAEEQARRQLAGETAPVVPGAVAVFARLDGRPPPAEPAPVEPVAPVPSRGAEIRAARRYPCLSEPARGSAKEYPHRQQGSWTKAHGYWCDDLEIDGDEESRPPCTECMRKMGASEQERNPGEPCFLCLGTKRVRVALPYGSSAGDCPACAPAEPAAVEPSGPVMCGACRDTGRRALSFDGYLTEWGPCGCAGTGKQGGS